MHTAPGNTASADLRQRIKRAEQRLDQSRTDGEFEANRQVIIWLKSELAALDRKAVA